MPLLSSVVPDAMIVVDGGRRILHANSQTERLFGYQHDELKGQPLEVLVPEPFRSSHACLAGEYVLHPRHRAMGSGLKLEGRRRDGSSFPVDISLRTLRAEGGPLTVARVRDITVSEATTGA